MLFEWTQFSASAEGALQTTELSTSVWGCKEMSQSLVCTLTALTERAKHGKLPRAGTGELASADREGGTGPCPQREAFHDGVF